MSKLASTIKSRFTSLKGKGSIKCAKCGEEVLAKDAFPSRHTSMEPKPKMVDRYKWCRKCWPKVSHEGKDAKH